MVELERLAQIKDLILVLKVVLVVLVDLLLWVVVLVHQVAQVVVNKRILQLMVVVEEDLLEQQFEEMVDSLLSYKISVLHHNLSVQRVPQELHK